MNDNVYINGDDTEIDGNNFSVRNTTASEFQGVATFQNNTTFNNPLTATDTVQFTGLHSLSVLLPSTFNATVLLNEDVTYATNDVEFTGHQPLLSVQEHHLPLMVWQHSTTIQTSTAVNSLSVPAHIHLFMK